MLLQHTLHATMRNLHGDIHGRWTPWDEFPDWYATYGFAVRRSPYTGPRTLHVDRGTCGPARGVVRYQSGPEPPPPAPTEGGFLSRLLRWRSPTRQVYFTSFIWYDAHGNTHECTREELCRAFRRLVGDWQELFTLACSVWSAWGAPYLESDGEALLANSDEALERENKLYCVIWPDVKRWREFGTRLWWEAEFFAQYLNYFIKLECAGEMPFAFRRYPGRIDCNLKTRFSDAVRMWNKDNQIDDWAFRMAKIVNQYESSWDQLHGVHGMRAVLVKARTDILNAKGYGAKEGAKHLSAVTGVRHVPPARAK